MAAGGSRLERMSFLAKAITGIVFVVLVAAVYFVVFFTAVDGEISQAVDTQAKLSADLKRAQEAKDAYQKDIDERTRRQQAAREQRKVLPDDPEMPSFLSSVQNMATSSGISLTSYTPQDEVPGDYYAKVPMALTISGHFNQIARFFYSIGKLDRIINIEDINMTVTTVTSTGKGKGEADEDVIVDVKCLATAFRSLKAGETASTRGRQK